MDETVKQEANTIIKFLDMKQDFYDKNPRAFDEEQKRQVKSALMQLAMLMKGYIAGLDYGKEEEEETPIEQGIEEDVPLRRKKYALCNCPDCQPKTEN